MNLKKQQREILVAKLEQLPPDRVSEVFDFIDFLHQKEQLKERDSLSVASEASLGKVWENREDSVYDNS